MAPPSISVPRQGLTGGAAVTLIAEGIAVPAGLITAMVMARGLGPHVYGRFAVVATTVALGEWLLIALFAPAVVRFVAAAEQWRPVAASSFRVYVGSGLAVAAALWTLAHPIALALDDAALAGDLRLFASQVPVFAAGAASRNILAGQGRYRQQAVASAAGWIGRAAFIVLFIELQFGLPGAILGSFCGTLVGALVAVAFVGPAVVGRGGLPSRQLMQLALPVFLGLVCARALERMGLFVLQAVGAAKADVGYYGAALNVMQVSGVIAAGIVPVLISTLTDASRLGDTARIRHVSAGAMRLGIVLLPLAAIGAGSSKDLVELLFGREFSAAAPLLASLVVASVALAMNGLMGGVLIAVNRPWVAAWVVMILSVIGLGVQLMVIPSSGASGAAQSTMVLALAAAAASAWAVSAAVPVAVPTRTIVRSAAFTALAYALSLGWDAPGPMVLVKVAALSLGVAVAFAITGELSKHEWSALGRVVSWPPSGNDRTTR